MEALWTLLEFDLISTREFRTIQNRMSRTPTRAASPNSAVISAVIGAVNRGCRYYPKTPACLQRSLALTAMLRRRGVAADVKIGIRQPPFESHAWVEIGGSVINDASNVRETFQTIHEFKAIESGKS
jgi:hypothetical protein